MNSHQPVLHQVQPAVPLSNGRSGHHGPYSPGPPFPQSYQGYQYPYPMPYQRGPQQWQHFPMHMSMGRGYQQYAPMTPYPMSQIYPSMQPSPQPAASSSSMRPAQGMLSPSSSSASAYAPSSVPVSAPSPHLAPPTPSPPPAPAATSTSAPPQRKPFYPPLPWQNFIGNFAARAPRRRKKPSPQPSHNPVQLPSRNEPLAESDALVEGAPFAAKPHPTSETIVVPTSLETPPTSQPSSEVFSTQPTTPSSVAAPQQITPKINASGRSNASVLPIIPAVPNLPASSRPPKKTSTSLASEAGKAPSRLNAELLDTAVVVAAQINVNDSLEAAGKTEADEVAAYPPIKAPPKSWADLVKTMSQPASNRVAPNNNDTNIQSNGFHSTKTGSLAEALKLYSVQEIKETSKIGFLEPRGLVNTGNMCYMNSILQILVFCVPFYTFLDSIGKQAAHNFKSDTPLMDSMIMFMREFSVIDAAVSVDQLRMRLKDNELEQYGEAFIPDFVYGVIRRLPRFSTMRRGHQQDAEEFLGFLLEELHDECSRAMKSNDIRVFSGMSTPTNGVISPISDSTGSQARHESVWLEVGPKQKSTITRSSGAIAAESPITKIFGGKLRSELRVPGMKNSVTLEPYQPLQLDIGASHVNNIIDALKGLTKSETLHGDFNSPRGPGSTATKQVTIETLPQVLILHLKRFQYDNAGGTQKIWKKVGYPLDLEIPKEVFPQHKRGGLLAQNGLPKYRLIGVVYHHGKNASGGHYTVDVRRQEGREWIRLDDTVIRRIRREDVAEGGSEEDPKVFAAALEQHKSEQSFFKDSKLSQQFATDEEEETTPEREWNQVNGLAPGVRSAGKKWSGIANGTATPVANSSGKMTPIGRAPIRDNKVAYILFYQKVDS